MSRGQHSALVLRRDESITLQYTAMRNIINQFKTVVIIVISLALQDVARSFYTTGDSERIDTSNFVIMGGISLIGLLITTIIEAYVTSWERSSLEMWRARIRASAAANA